MWENHDPPFGEGPARVSFRAKRGISLCLRHLQAGQQGEIPLRRLTDRNDIVSNFSTRSNTQGKLFSKAGAVWYDGLRSQGIQNPFQVSWSGHQAEVRQ